MKDQRRLYGDLAWTWPIISPPEHYVEEATELCEAIRRNAQTEVKSLLDLGCGGGHNDYALKNEFDVTGVDISANMLALAKQLNPEISYLHGDMRTVRLNKVFDAVTIFDSIDYMLTEGDMRASFITALTHLKPGGIFCTYAEETLERFQQNHTEYSTNTRGDIEITFIENTYDPDPTDTTYESTFVYLIRREGQLDIETDHHLCGIFPLETWRNLLTEVGFEVKQLDFEEGDCPLFVCTKPY